MARPKSRYPTEQELRLLEILWRKGAQNVGQVRTELAASGRDVSHTSVAKILGIMVSKGYLTRTRAGREFRYMAAATAEGTQTWMLSDLLKRVFEGSPTLLVNRLLAMEEVDENAIRQLREMIDAASSEGTENDQGKVNS